MQFDIRRYRLTGDPYRLETIVYSPRTRVTETPLLFVHGAWHAAWCWEEHFLPYFARHGYLAVAFSLRGHGRSEGQEALSRFRLKDYVADLERMVDQLEHLYGRPPIVLGHSMGAYLAQALLRVRPLPGCVLLAPVPPSGMRSAAWKMFRRHPSVTAVSFLTVSPNWIIRFREVAADSFFSRSMPAATLARILERLQPESVRAMLDLFGPLDGKVLQENLPLLVLGGADDQLLEPRDVQETAAFFGQEPVVLQHIAHDLMLEPRWEHAASLLAGWLESNFLSPSVLESLHTAQDPTSEEDDGLEEDEGRALALRALSRFSTKEATLAEV